MGKNKKKRAKGTGSISISQESDLRLVARGSGAAGGEDSLALVERGGIGAEMMSGGRLSMGAMSWVSSSQAEKEGYVGMTYAETIAELRRENAQRVVSQELQASTENLYEAVTQHLADWVAGVDCPKQQVQPFESNIFSCFLSTYSRALLKCHNRALDSLVVKGSTMASTSWRSWVFFRTPRATYSASCASVNCSCLPRTAHRRCRCRM